MKEITSNFELEINKNFSELSEKVAQAITGGCSMSGGCSYVWWWQKGFPNY